LQETVNPDRRLLKTLALPLGVAFYQWQGDSNTYSYLLHSHAGKTAIDWLLADVLGRWAPSYDIGHAMQTLVPTLTSPVCAAAMVAGGLATLALLPHLRAVPGRRANLPLFAFCAVSCVKTIADGGPLTYHFVPAFMVLLVLLAQASGLSPHGCRRLAAVGLLTWVGYLALWAAISDEPGIEAVHGPVSTCSVMALLWWLGLPPSQRWWGWRAATGLASAAAVALALAVSVVSTPLALLLPLTAGSLATRCDLQTLRCRSQLVEVTRALDVDRAGGDDPLKPRWTSIDTAPTRIPKTGMAALIHPLQTAAPRPGTGQAVSVSTVRSLPQAGAVLL